MSTYKPTILYIKQHAKTGKLYFGKTQRLESFFIGKYLGSGKHWVRHINYHGRNSVVTLWYQLYDNVFDLTADALSMSNSLNIVESSSWLNYCVENGRGGSNFHTADTRAKISTALKGVPQSSELIAKRVAAINYTERSDEIKSKISMKLTNFYDYKLPDGSTIKNIGTKELCKRFDLYYTSASRSFRNGRSYKGFVRIIS